MADSKPTGAVVRQGYLYKEGGMIKSWKKRFFRLKDNKQINYYENENGKKPLGVINLSNMYRCEADQKINTNFSMECATRTWKFRAENPAEKESWVLAIKNVTGGRIQQPAAAPAPVQQTNIAPGVPIYQPNQPTYTPSQPQQNFQQPNQAPMQTNIWNTHVDRPGRYKVVKKTKFKNDWALASNPVGAIDVGEHVIITEVLEVDGRIRGKTNGGKFMTLLNVQTGTRFATLIETSTQNQVEGETGLPFSAPAPAPVNSSEGLPPGWTTGVDPSSGRTFYVNTIAQMTQWERPAPVNAAPPSYQQVQNPAPPQQNQPNNWGMQPQQQQGAPNNPGAWPIANQQQQQQPAVAPSQQQQPGAAPPQQSPYTAAPPGGWPNQPYQQPPNNQQQQYQPQPNQPPQNYQPQPNHYHPSAPAYPTLPQNLAPPANYPGFTRFDQGRIGIEFVLRQGKFILTVVRRNTPAANMGVRVGQQIESVYDGYGRPVQGSNAPQLAQQISNAPRPVHIKFVASNVRVVQRAFNTRPYHVYRRRHDYSTAAAVVGAAAVGGMIMGAMVGGPHHRHHHRHHHRGGGWGRGRGRGWGRRW